MYEAHNNSSSRILFYVQTVEVHILILMLFSDYSNHSMFAYLTFRVFCAVCHCHWIINAIIKDSILIETATKIT